IPILSRVTSKKEAIIWHKNMGPCFGLQDLWINSNSMFGSSKQKSYEKKIINKTTFEIEEYEVKEYVENNPLKVTIITITLILSYNQRRLLRDRIVLISYAIVGNDRQIALNYLLRHGLEIREIETIKDKSWFWWVRWPVDKIIGVTSSS
ncbi:9854_t:CDS:2, partial [Rhizophagus irregularis]